MQTHKNIFFWTLIVTLVTTAGYFLTKENSLIGDFCLALLGSSAIATFLEFVNYITAKRHLIMQLIADNDTIANYINDAVWFYNISTDKKRKLDEFVLLYEKCQNYTFTLTKEAYTPILSKEKLTDVIEKNTVSMVELLDILLKGQRQIISFREARNQIDYEEMDKDIANEILDEQLVGIIDQYVEPLKNNEIILMECNEKYKTAYKLTNAAKVKQHLEVIEEIANEIDSSNKEQS